MIKFDISKLTIEYTYLKSITTALGGAMTVTESPSSTSKTRIKIPFYLARSFKKRYEVTDYLKPVVIAVARYDDTVVALERHPLSSIGTKVTQTDTHTTIWKSELEKSIITQIPNETARGDWFTDGVFIYTFIDENPIDLTQDKSFQSVAVDAISYESLIVTGALVDTTRTCVQYTTSTGSVAVSPPIWKTLSTVGDKHITSADGDTPAFSSYQFDKVNEALSVNLSFALKAANQLSKLYGYDAIEPLALDELMIKLSTVNLPNQPTHIKRTFDIGMSFTHAIAWLIGLGYRTQTLESYKIIRSLLKFLTTQGVYFSYNLSSEALFQPNVSYKDIPLMSIDDINNRLDDTSISDIIRINNVRNRRSVGTDNSVDSIGALYDAR